MTAIPPPPVRGTTKAKNKSDDQSMGGFGQLVLLIALVTLMTFVFWNAGLRDAGIVDHGIDWSESFGLGIGVLLARTIAAGAS